MHVLLLVVIFLHSIHFVRLKTDQRSNPAADDPTINSKCDFESGSCQWFFTNSAELQGIITDHRLNHTVGDPYSRLRKVGSGGSSENGFNVVVGGENGASNHYAYCSSKNDQQVPMIVSPFYEHTSKMCELAFRYRILGDPGSNITVAIEQLSLFVSSKYRQHNEITDGLNHSLLHHADDDYWIWPIAREHFHPDSAQWSSGKQWKSARVSIGMFEYPSRIRIECHANKSADVPSSRRGEDDDANVECSVYDIELVNCDEEAWQSDTCVDTRSETRISCLSDDGIKLCLKPEDLCDMHPECADAADEIEVHNCSFVSPGARCNFEDIQYPAGCQSWYFYSGYMNSNSTVGQSHLVSLSMSNGQRQGLPPNEYNFHGKNYQPGHFLFFSSYDHPSSKHEIVYTYAQSRFFPPLPSDYQKSHCALRFFYCQSGSFLFHVFLVSKDNPRESKPLWTPPTDHVKQSCEWRRAVAPLKASILTKNGKSPEYAIRLSFAKITGSLGSIAIDDLTLSPGCFADASLWRMELIPERLTVSSCGVIGADRPKEEICPSSSESSDEISYTELNKWRVPIGNFFRVEVYGASGGIMPGQIINNRGGAVIANVFFPAGSELSTVVGQRGLCPCDLCFAKQSCHENYQQQTVGIPLSYQQKWKRICTALEQMTGTTSRILSDSVEILGCGGGGASVLLLNSAPLMVAGGGGGSFMFDGNDIPGLRMRAEGGTLIEPQAIPEKSSHVSGNGVSISSKKNSNSSSEISDGGGKMECDDCTEMSGRRILDGTLAAGICPESRQWNLTGGHGGGGASCGPGAGGGGGFMGGHGQYMAFGHGGSSAFLAPAGSSSYLMRSGYNFGNGRVQVLACPQHQCPANSTCMFEKPTELEESPVAFCLCNFGERKVPLDSSTCSIQEPLNVVVSFIKNYFLDDNIGFQLLCFILSLLCVCLVLLCITNKYCSAQNKQQRTNIHELLDIAETNSTLSRPWTGNKISGNPIYEAVQFSELQALDVDLPSISRQSLKLERVIGHGAFGEVYEGILYHGDGLATKVAVKSLLTDQARGDANDDFVTEARLLSQFKHDNIVSFYGVSFEQQPKYIVLEFLEGGDLKNFLRENRPKKNANGNSEQPSLQMADLVSMALDVARACEHLEATKFVHRDIAARNCLLTSKGEQRDNVRRVVKIADFGMARWLGFRNDYYRKGGKAFLPVRWMPPESFLDGIFTSKTDAWAFGVLLWEIFSMGFVPYSGRENHEVMKLVVAGDRLEPPIGVLPDIYEVMLCCWNTDAESRPHFSTLVQILVDFLRRDDVQNAPLPPIRHRLLERSISATPSTTCGHQAENPLSTVSQTTETTVLSSTTTEREGTGSVCHGTGSFASYDSMPTAGAGVTRNVFPPYQPKLADPLISIDGRQRVPSTGGIFGCTDSSASSHDDSTLHESAASIKLNQIRRPNNNNNNGGGSATGPSQTSLVSKIPAPKSSAKSVPCHQENRKETRPILTPPFSSGSSAAPKFYQERRASLPTSTSPTIVMDDRGPNGGSNLGHSFKMSKMSDLAYKPIDFSSHPTDSSVIK